MRPCAGFPHGGPGHRQRQDLLASAKHLSTSLRDGGFGEPPSTEEMWAPFARRLLLTMMLLLECGRNCSRQASPVLVCEAVRGRRRPLKVVGLTAIRPSTLLSRRAAEGDRLSALLCGLQQDNACLCERDPEGGGSGNCGKRILHLEASGAGEVTVLGLLASLGPLRCADPGLDLGTLADRTEGRTLHGSRCTVLVGCSARRCERARFSVRSIPERRSGSWVCTPRNVTAIPTSTRTRGVTPVTRAHKGGNVSNQDAKLVYGTWVS